jgi:hypothetical protein
MIKLEKNAFSPGFQVQLGNQGNKWNKLCLLCLLFVIAVGLFSLQVSWLKIQLIYNSLVAVLDHAQIVEAWDIFLMEYLI